MANGRLPRGGRSLWRDGAVCARLKGGWTLATLQKRERNLEEALDDTGCAVPDALLLLLPLPLSDGLRSIGVRKSLQGACASYRSKMETSAEFTIKCDAAFDTAFLDSNKQKKLVGLGPEYTPGASISESYVKQSHAL